MKHNYITTIEYDSIYCNYVTYYAYRYNLTSGTIINTYIGNITPFSFIFVANGYVYTGSNYALHYFNATSSAYIGNISYCCSVIDMKYITSINKFIYSFMNPYVSLTYCTTSLGSCT